MLNTVKYMPKPPQDLRQIQSLVELVQHLRGPEGCPWDKEQTHLSLTQYAIEETFEMIEALEQGDDQKTKEELGDVLFQVILHSQLAAERQAFDFADVIETLNKKLVRRHPHVFADVKLQKTEDVIREWEEIKKKEKALRAVHGAHAGTAVQDGGTKAGEASSSVNRDLDVPPGLPALQRAHKIGQRTEKLQFDWENAEQVWLKVEEESRELREALDAQSAAEIEHELGDVLFSLAQLSRHLKMDPEQALRVANRRFEQRFYKMKELLQANGKELSTATPAEKENFWQLAKKALAGSEKNSN